MPRYSYTGLAAGGEKIASVADAPSLPALAADLASDGIVIKTAHEIRKDVPRVRGVPYFDVIAIYRQIASSIKAGLPLAETLQMLSTESRNSQMKSLLYFLKAQVAEGTPLSEAMALFPDVFPRVHAAVVKAGEESGQLEHALADLAEQAESFSNMNRRFASSLVYPAVIACVALSLLTFAAVGIVPKFKQLFGDLGIVDLPTFTGFVMFVATWVAPAVALIGTAILIISAIIIVRRGTVSGRMWVDNWKLRLPVVGQIVEKASLARFSGTLGLLLDAGIDLPRAMRLASEGTGNKTIEQVLKHVSTEVELGQTLSDSLGKTGAMPPTLAWRIGVGEETGTLGEALLGISQLYAKQVDSMVTSLAGMLEPVLILMIGSGVALLVVGMFLPLVQIIQSLSGAY